MKLDKLGWIIAAGLTVALITSGFQGSSLKFATVDVEKAFNESSLTKENQDQLRTYGSKRVEILKFLGANRAMNPADAQSYSELSILPKPTDADTTKLKTITASALADTQKQTDIAQKTTPSADDQHTLSDYHSKAQSNTEFLQRLEGKYDQDIQEQQKKLKNDALDKVRKTIAEIARKQGYSIVFSIDSAPYAQNNITDEIVKDINKS